MNIDSQVITILQNACLSGNKIHAFLSGGGIRVIRIEHVPTNLLLGYGESAYLSQALRIAAEDFNAGGRSYFETHYLTGSSSAEDELDGLVLQGRSFDAFANDGVFCFELRGLEFQSTPKEKYEQAIATGATVLWTDSRGVVWKTRGQSTCLVSRPEGMSHHNAYSWRAIRQGCGTSLPEAIAAAFAVPRVEERAA